MLRKWLTGLTAFVFGILATLTLLEIALRLLPVCKGNYGAEPDSKWPVHHLVPNSDFTFSTGWDLENVRRGHINNLGYVAPFDYQLGTSAVVVIGDSYIANEMNDYSDSIQGSLPALLARPMLVLGFGMSGASLAHDLGIAGLVRRHFNPSWAVVLVTRGNFIDGFSSIPGYFRWDSGSTAGITLIAERRHGRLAMALRDLSLVAYGRNNLRADISTLLGNSKKVTPARCRPTMLTSDDVRLVEFTAEELPRRFNLAPSRVILVFDADRESIYEPSASEADQRCPSRDELGRKLLARIATARGIKVIDMEPVFRAQYLRTGEHFDYLPVDGHWNGIAHHLAADEVARYINANEGAPL